MIKENGNGNARYMDKKYVQCNICHRFFRKNQIVEMELPTVILSICKECLNETVADFGNPLVEKEKV